jgi:hypothetical protein
MGELLDALNALDDRGPLTDPISRLIGPRRQVFRAASQRVNEAWDIAGFISARMASQHAASHASSRDSLRAIGTIPES